MTVRRVGLYRNRWHQYSFGSSPWYPGVTTILRVQDAITGSDGLVRWATKLAAEAAFGVAKKPESPDFQTALDAAVSAVDGARDRGTKIHAGLEAQIKDSEHIPNESDGKVWYAWSRFLLREKPEIIASERMVFNPKHKYGGTLDLDCEIRGKRALIDVKTGQLKDVAVLQLAGLASPECFWGGEDDPERHENPEYEAFYVLLLNDNGYELVPLNVGAEEIAHFHFLADTYHALKAWNARDITEVQAA